MTDEQPAMSLTVEDFLTYVKETKSKRTFKEYRIGLEKFSKFFGKSQNEILEMRKQDWIGGDLHRKKRFTREIEKFHAWLKKQSGHLNLKIKTYGFSLETVQSRK